ncbi:response regulator [Photobacterium rosenbergii]|uniref:Response regulator n=1 Tax=Photobacterium rosenbergii TaxID=294936 RepID=A0ABU3ZFT3_9GAMM|nr:response regulator [Photobacterium rosenbergii]MDV5168965.1 response regulator [Photobacterium rosenbergii]
MSYNKTVLICDDSRLVHRAMQKFFGDYEGVTLFFAENGQQALDVLAQNNIDVMFLDLTMPVLDGFGVLQRLPVNHHPTKIIVLSADVQQQAIERCVDAGANYFLAKPFSRPQIEATLIKMGISLIPKNNTPIEGIKPKRKVFARENDYLYQFKEVANIALGRGAAIISDHSGEFITMPLPNVAMLGCGELEMMISNQIQRADSTAIAQRFVGGGIHGEALVCLYGQDISTFGKRLGFSTFDDKQSEVIIDIANLMVSSFLVSLTEQMNIPFSIRQPICLEEYMVRGITEIANGELFTIEYSYQSEKMDMACDVLLMMDHNSTQVIRRFMETLQ